MLTITEGWICLGRGRAWPIVIKIYHYTFIPNINYWPPHVHAREHHPMNQ